MVSNNNNDNDLKKRRKLIQKLRIYCQDRNRIRHGRCAILAMKSRKIQITEGIELPNQERIRPSQETENYKYLGILEANN